MINPIPNAEVGSSPAEFAAAGFRVVFAATGFAAGEFVGREVFAYDPASRTVSLVANLGPGGENSNPAELTSLGGRVVFRATHLASASYELWATDGTPQGTTKIRRFSSPGQPIDFSPGLGGVYFVNHGIADELWRTDGTPEGTVRIAGTDEARFPSEAGGRVFLRANDSEHGSELWVSDGVPGGATGLLADLVPGPLGSTPRSFAPDGARVFFLARSNSSAWRLWVSDGTVAGTRSLTDDVYASELAPCGIVYRGKLWFQTINGSSAVSDGTPEGTGPAPAPAGVVIERVFGVIGDKLLVRGRTPELGRELWTTDGTDAATVLLADIVPGAESGVPTPGDIRADIAYVRAAGSTLIRTDGTPQGTQVVGTGLAEYTGVIVGGQFAMVVQDPVIGAEPSFLAHDQTQPVIFDLNASTRGIGDSLVAWNERVVFSADDAVVGDELWNSDGTADGTLPLADLRPGPEGSSPRDLVNLDGRLFFHAATPDPRLWEFTSSGPVQYQAELGTLLATLGPTLLGHYEATGVSELRAANGPSEPARTLASIAPATVLTVRGAQSYVAFTTWVMGPTPLLELWRTDGTLAGTHPLLPAGTYTMGIAPIAALGDRCISALSTPALGLEPWITDGSTAGTVLLKDLVPGTGTSKPDWFITRGGTVLFRAGPSADRRIWSTDGTSDGTLPGVALPSELRTAQTEVTGFGQGLITSNLGVWYVDTQRVEELYPSSSFVTLTKAPAFGKLFFIRKQMVNGVPLAFEIYGTDGTAAGTRRISTLIPPPNPACEMTSPVVAGATLFVRYDDGVQGPELYAMQLCPADYDLNGQVDFFDYLDFIAAYNAELPGADFDGNAQVDFFDYLEFVGAFSAGC
jgi:ELWxxDGT repeat protein